MTALSAYAPATFTGMTIVEGDHVGISLQTAEANEPLRPRITVAELRLMALSLDERRDAARFSGDGSPHAHLPPGSA